MGENGCGSGGGNGKTGGGDGCSGGRDGEGGHCGGKEGEGGEELIMVVEDEGYLQVPLMRFCHVAGLEHSAHGRFCLFTDTVILCCLAHSICLSDGRGR